MKAQFVYENTNFERGRDPKSSMGIGLVALLDKKIKDKFRKFIESTTGSYTFNAGFYSRDGKVISFSGNADSQWKSTLNYYLKINGITEYLEMPGKNMGSPRSPRAEFNIKKEFQKYFIEFDKVNFIRGVYEFSHIGANTSWSRNYKGENITISLNDINNYLDKNKVPVKYVDPKSIEQHLIKVKRDPQRINKSNLDFPIIIAKKNGEFVKILDGQHRVVKGLINKIDKIKVRVLDLDNVPHEYQHMFENVNFERGKSNIRDIIGKFYLGQVVTNNYEGLSWNNKRKIYVVADTSPASNHPSDMIFVDPDNDRIHLVPFGNIIENPDTREKIFKFQFPNGSDNTGVYTFKDSTRSVNREEWDLITNEVHKKEPYKYYNKLMNKIKKYSGGVIPKF